MAVDQIYESYSTSISRLLMVQRSTVGLLMVQKSTVGLNMESTVGLNMESKIK